MNCNIVIGIPTVGRAAILCETLRELMLQTRPADAIIVCATKAADVDGIHETGCAVKLLLSEPGLPRQRNAIIAEAGAADIIVFFDDDFLPAPGYLGAIERHMLADPGIVVATGYLLADGINGPGILPDTARTLLSSVRASSNEIKGTFSGYGCNMAVRMAPIRDNDVRVDERLPLYGWQEDVDFSRRLAVFGSVVQICAAQGVHLGAKYGRGSGVRLGYSQVANPLYLCSNRRGYPWRRALSHISCNMAMNIVRSARPEPYIDRRGRLAGNLLAIRDLMIGRMTPERILEL